MSRYRLRPELEIDWNKPPLEVIDQWVDAYFKERAFSSDEIFRAEIWKMVAIFSWVMMACGSIILLASNS